MVVFPQLLPRWRVGAGVRAALLAAAGLALGASAAVVLQPVDLLQPDGGLTARPGGALERALTADTNTSQRNLELLLDARQAGETGVMGAARAGELPANRPVLPVAESRRKLVPLGLQVQDNVTAPGGAERREWLTSATFQQLVSVRGSPVGPGTGNRREAASPRPGGGDVGEVEPSRASQAVAETLQFLRDNRFWLLGAVGLLIAGAAGLQASVRRR